MDRIFLDANILFSAANRPGAGLLRLWKLKRVELVTSAYALEEARRNLPEEEQRKRLEELAFRILVVPNRVEELPLTVTLPDKDRPILQAAMHCKATHLLTGDVTDFGPYFGKTVGGVLILPPAAYLRRKNRRK